MDNQDGLYEVLFPKGASGDPKGSDPWVSRL